MQRIVAHSRFPWYRPHPKWDDKSKSHRMAWLRFALFVAAVLLTVTLPISTPAGANKTGESLLSKNGSSQAANSSFEQAAAKLAISGSPEAFRSLTQSLGEGKNAAERDIALTTLANASSPNVVPALLDALQDTDRSVRAGAAQILGMRHETVAIAALTDSLRDPSARVRLEAVRSLSHMNSWQVLPLLNLLAVDEPSLEVRTASMSAKEALKTSAALDLGVPLAQIIDVSAAGAESQKLYLITKRDTYVRTTATKWTRSGPLPGAPVSLTAGGDPDLLFLVTTDSGLYRTTNGGVTWEYAQFGADTPSQLLVTAVTVDPANSRRLYAALATKASQPDALSAMGIFASSDDGSTWTWLEGSPMHGVTTRLAMDPQSPGYLFGMAEETPWRFKLPDQIYQP